MIGDIRTILWKERKEVSAHLGTLRLVLVVAVFGILLPLLFGRSFVTSSSSLLWFLWLPVLLISNVAADSFAGERERHTLETLLASRLSDRSILFGKTIVAALYGYLVSLAAMALAPVVVNLAFPGGDLAVYPLESIVSGLLLGFLVAWLAAVVGCLISLRAPTVRQAQQTLGLVGILPILPVLALQVLPAEWQAGLASFLGSVGPMGVILLAAAILGLADVAVYRVAMRQFSREKLVVA